jgi:hypothetical protein
MATDVAKQTNERTETMNWDQIEGKWKKLKGRFGEKWAKTYEPPPGAPSST